MKIRKENQTELAQYYRRSGWWYKHFWDIGGLHHGIFEGKTSNHRQAVENQYRLVIDAGKIRQSMRVLDIGCGVGDGACYIAKNTGAKIVGISIVPEQVKSGIKLSMLENLSNLVTFKVMNFQHTDFPPDYFDVVYGIESVSHSPDKHQLLKEMSRILKSGGKLIVSDGYLIRKPENMKENACLKNLLDGWHMYELIHIDTMLKHLKSNNLIITLKKDYITAITNSINKMKILVMIGSIFPINQAVRDNVRGMKGWVAGVGDRLFGYYLFVAQKK